MLELALNVCTILGIFLVLGAILVASLIAKDVVKVGKEKR